MSENRVLRRIFGPKRDEVTESGENYIMRSLLLIAQYCSGDKIEKNKIGGVFSMYGERRCVYRVLVVKPEGKKTLGRPRLRWEDNIKMDLKEVGSDGMDWLDLAQDRDSWRTLVNVVMNLLFHKVRGIT